MTALEVGRIIRPHGLRGQVVVELVTNRVERMEPGSRLQCDGRTLEITAAGPHRGRWLVSFAGVDSIDRAEQLRNRVLTAEAIDDDAAIWVHEVIGSRLVDTEGVDRGEIVSVEANPASDLLVLDGGGLVPLNFVVDHGPGRVVADLPPGLLEGP